MTRPTVAPDFATDTNYPAGADPWSGQPNKISPGGIVATGFIPATFLDTSHVNYELNNHGAWINYLDAAASPFYGSGVDGAAVFDGVSVVTGCSGTGPYTALRDLFYTDVTMSAGVKLNMAGFRLYVNGTLNTSALSVDIKADGGTGGSGGTGGAAGTRPGANGVVGADSNGAGGAGGVNGGTSKALTVALGSAGGTGGTGLGGGAPGTSGVTAPTAAMGNISVPTSIISGMLYGSGGINVVQGGCGGGGGQGSGVLAGGGGGGGGGVLIICARVTRFAASTRLGAAGGAGGAGAVGAGGGGGGGGGAVLLVYRSVYSGSTTPSAAIIDVTGGNGGALGAGGGNGAAGSAGQSIIWNA